MREQKKDKEEDWSLPFLKIPIPPPFLASFNHFHRLSLPCFYAYLVQFSYHVLISPLPRHHPLARAPRP